MARYPTNVLLHKTGGGGGRFWLQSLLWHKSLSDLGQVRVACLSSSLHLSNRDHDSDMFYTGLSKCFKCGKRFWNIVVSDGKFWEMVKALHATWLYVHSTCTYFSPKGRGGRGSKIRRLFGSFLCDQRTFTHFTSFPILLSILHPSFFSPILSIWLKTGYQLLYKQELSLSMARFPHPFTYSFCCFTLIKGFNCCTTQHFSTSLDPRCTSQ